MSTFQSWTTGIAAAIFPASFDLIYLSCLYAVYRKMIHFYGIITVSGFKYILSKTASNAF